MQKARIEKLTKEEIKKQEEESKSHPTIDLDDDRLAESHQEHSEQDEVLHKDEVQTDDEHHGIDSEEESEEIRYEKVSEQNRQRR